MPDGASFSEGRPYGATGWSLRPDEIGELRFRLPEARSGASDMRIELLAADGAVLAQSETRLNVAAADPAEAETVSAVESSPSEQIARAEAPKPVGKTSHGITIYAPSGGHRQTAGPEIRPTTLRDAAVNRRSYCYVEWPSCDRGI